MSANKSRSIFSLIAISFSLAVFASPISTAAVAQNNDSSMDSMFNEGESKKPEGKKGGAAPAPGADAEETKNAEGAEPGTTAAPHRRRRRVQAGPLTSTDVFAHCAIVQGSGWPAIGPFRAGPGKSLKDPAQNILKVEANEKKEVTAVELQLLSRSAHDFMCIEMTSDFLLEGLNTKPARIADFNVALEKARTQILGKSTRTDAKINAGQYVVFIRPDAENLNDLTIRIEGPDGGQEVSLADKVGQPAPVVAVATVKPPPANNSSATTPTPDDTNKPGSRIAEIFKHVVPKSGNDEKPDKPEDMKASVKSLVESWQKIKRDAVKNRDISKLNTVLSGHALAVQTGGIKWLSEHHKYYDMLPKNLEFGAITETVKDKKFNVMTTIKEVSKLYDEQSNQLLRDSEDTYVVNYTVEKADGKYFISDSSIVKYQTPPGTAPKK